MRVVRLLAAGLVGVIGLFGVVERASVQTDDDPVPPPITDYANYPLGLGLIPAGCTAEGSSVVEGEAFSVNGGAATSDLRQLEITSGDVVTMTWESFASGCEGIGISLSSKVSESPTFDATANQVGNAAAYCGPRGAACVAPFSLTLDLAGDGSVPCFQIDAHIGPQLDVVGPDGAFYRLNQPFDMLISAKNVGTEPCEIVEPCATNPDLPADSAACTEIVEVVVTTPPTLAEPPPPPPAAKPAVPAASTQSIGATLPATGVTSWVLAVAAMVCIGAGWGIIVLTAGWESHVGRRKL